MVAELGHPDSIFASTPPGVEDPEGGARGREQGLDGVKGEVIVSEPVEAVPWIGRFVAVVAGRDLVVALADRLVGIHRLIS